MTRRHLRVKIELESVIDMAREKGKGKRSKKEKVRYVLVPIRFTMRDIEEAFLRDKTSSRQTKRI